MAATQWPSEVIGVLRQCHLWVVHAFLAEATLTVEVEATRSNKKTIIEHKLMGVSDGVV